MFARLLSIAPALFMGAMLLVPLAPIAHAHDEGQASGTEDHEWRPNPEKLRALIKARLETLSGKLAITPAQQPAWNEFAKSVEALADFAGARPDKDADAAAIARYRADMAARLAKKLAAIAETTGKLQAALNENQRKTFNEEYRHFRRHGHGCKHDDEHDKGNRHDDGMDEEEGEPS